jgi:hypothetical protein
MARKSTADAAKDKAAKQKKIVIGLAVFLVLAMAYAVHTMSSLKGGGAASSKPQAVAAGSTTTPAPVTTTPVDSATPVAPSLAGTTAPTDPAATAGSTPSTGSSSDSSQLVSVLIPKADSGQLDSFSRFETKDPFAAGGPSSSSGGSSGTGGTGGTSGTPTTPKVPPAPPAPPPTAAVIAVNGTSEAVTSGSNFPLSNPVAGTNGLFELVSLGKTTATVSVVGGSYSSGSQTLTLRVNKPVTLVNTADGTRYTLLLYPQGTAAPVAAPASGGASSGGASSGGSSTTPPVTAPPTG